MIPINSEDDDFLIVHIIIDDQMQMQMVTGLFEENFDKDRYGTANLKP